MRTVLCLLVLVAAVRAREDDGGPVAVSEAEKGKLFFGSYSTTTYTNIVASTSTVWPTCYTKLDAKVCTGRKNRLARSKPTLFEEIDEGMEISSSLDSSEPNDESQVAKSDKERIAFTVWTTSRTTSTVTVMYTNTSTTVRLSFLCTAGAMSTPSACTGV